MDICKASGHFKCFQRYQDFILSANVENKINDIEKLLNVTYLRNVIVPELERMVKESNVDSLYDDAIQFINTTFLLEYVVPEVEKVLLLYKS